MIETASISLRSSNTSWQTLYRRIQGDLTAAEQRTGAYFESHPEAAYYSITEVVDRSGLGYGTIIRFCQKMGCRGFQEFKLALARDSAAASESEATSSGGDFGEQLRQDLHETIRLLDYDVLEKAVERILASRSILIAGVASSAPSVLSLAWKLKRIGLHAHSVTEGYIMAVDAFLMNEDDLLIVFSSSGATKDLLHAAEVASSKQASVLAITNFSSSPLSLAADLALYTSASRDPLKAEVPSIISGEAIGELLLNRLLELAPERREHLIASFQAVSNRKV